MTETTLPDLTPEKPPIGIMPAGIFYADRILALSMAIRRFIGAGREPLPEWETELEALAELAAYLHAGREQIDRPSREEVAAAIAEINTKNRAYHGGTHTDLINAVNLLTRLMPPVLPTINDFLKGAPHAE